MNFLSKGPQTGTKIGISDNAAVLDITVIGGAGHVGNPLVLAFAEAGMTVNVNHLNEATLATLRAGKLPFIELGAGPVIGIIGTPVDEFLNPVTAAVQRCIDHLLPHIADEQLIVLRYRVAAELSCPPEVPAQWFERTHGPSRFRVLDWLPAYLRWYRYAFATTYLRLPANSVKLRSSWNSAT